MYATEIFFIYLARFREYFNQSPKDFIHQFRTKNWKQADQRYISARLERLFSVIWSQRRYCELHKKYILNRSRSTVSRREDNKHSASYLSLSIILTQPIVEAVSPNDKKCTNDQLSQMQKLDQDMEQQEEVQDSSMTKDSDRATIAEAQK
ncbi:MAG: hypothetical protein EZS28_027177 [Streblomastix strix]|uniref:Uncharacterized protein n=1 Tax=Streblomastix strix TaxID=222440 RepID=A0A5J4V3V4_9EUKA|nr:MAG: hypothetical protein EZS28_027177 [Streblomastix strix]